jgi:hypothetical protein
LSTGALQLPQPGENEAFSADFLIVQALFLCYNVPEESPFTERQERMSDT